MEFTLEQLSPDNVTSLFDGAYYKAETNRVRNQGDETEVAVTTTVWSDGRPVQVYASPTDQVFVFRYSANYGEATEAQVLRACNLIDEFPVHARAEKDADGAWVITFIYKHIVPEGVGLGAREIVGVFRVFEKLLTAHMQNFHALVMQAE